jgi:DNA repair protein RecN (Recombination protein N)
VAGLWARWKAAGDALESARSRQGDLQRERERLAWQIGEVERLAPGEQEWDELSAEHQRLSHGQALLDAARGALDAVSDGEPNADALASRAIDLLAEVAEHDT